MLGTFGMLLALSVAHHRPYGYLIILIWGLLAWKLSWSAKLVPEYILSPKQFAVRAGMVAVLLSALIAVLPTALDFLEKKFPRPKAAGQSSCASNSEEADKQHDGASKPQAANPSFNGTPGGAR